MMVLLSRNKNIKSKGTELNTTTCSKESVSDFELVLLHNPIPRMLCCSLFATSMFFFIHLSIIAFFAS